MYAGQRCPAYTSFRYEEFQQDPDKLLFLTHKNGIAGDNDSLLRLYKNRKEHDPSNLTAAFELAYREDVIPIGLLYHNPDAPRYDQFAAQGLEMTSEERLAALETELDRFAVQ